MLPEQEDQMMRQQTRCSKITSVSGAWGTWIRSKHFQKVNGC
jgi:hypothetical protein